MAHPSIELGIASSIVQLITFTSSLVTKSHEIYKSADGALVESLELETITKSLQELSSELLLPVSGRGASTKTERKLQELCNSCCDVSSQLVEVIQSLKAQSTHKRWNSFRQALSSVWKEDKIQELSTRLERYRRQIDTTLLASLREHIQGIGSGSFLWLFRWTEAMASRLHRYITPKQLAVARQTRHGYVLI